MGSTRGKLNSERLSVCRLTRAASLRLPAQRHRKRATIILTALEGRKAAGSVLLKPWPSMDEEESYLFDTNGFVILRNVLGGAELQALNEAVDRHADAVNW